MNIPNAARLAVSLPWARQIPWRIALPMACLCAAMSGCTTYQAQPINPETEAAAFEAHSLGPGPWTLARLQAEAERHHPDADIALAKRKAADAAAIAAGARANPTLSTSAQKNTSAEPGAHAWTYTLGLDFPLETAGMRDYRAAQAAWQARSAAYAQADALWHIRAHVREAYIGSYPLQGLAQERQAIREQLLKETQRRLAAGMVASDETLQARLAAKQAVLSAEEARQRRLDSLRKLAAAVGVPAHALDGTGLAFADLADEVLPDAARIGQASKSALQSRPDVLAALAEYEASQANLQLEIARQYPDITLGPGYSWDAGALKWSLGLSLALPLFDRNQGAIAQAEAKRQEAAATFRSVQAQAIADIGDALAAYSQAKQMLALVQGMAVDQGSRLRSTQLAFKAGAVDRLAMLEAQLEASLAESRRIEALLEAHRAAGRLEDALRQPLSPSPSSLEPKGQP
ncbi:MAG: TolC family protein [Burkholderiales bacterium]|nr:TolC family protein [Burkholderiales bacterium]